MHPPRLRTTFLNAKAAAQAWLSDGRQALRDGKAAIAQSAFTEAIKLDNSSAAAHYELGNCWRRTGQPAKAEKFLQAALQRDPALVDAYISLAFLYREQGSPEQAAAVIMALLAEKPRDIKTHHQMGGLLDEFRCYDKAAQVYERLTRLTPQAEQVYQRLGQMHQKLGHYARAATAFEKAIELNPDAGSAYLLLAHTRRVSSADTGLLERMERTLASPALGRDTAICLHFALGKLYDDIHRYSDAFRHFRTGNTLKNSQQPFDRETWKHQIEALKRVFTRERLEQAKQTHAASGSRPVFVVGMLRSGTTLVERIVARHPNAYGAGELDLLDSLAMRTAQITEIPYPDCAIQLNPAQAEQLRAEYKAQWPLEGRRAARVVDKNPLNFIHIGLAALVLPDSCFIHCIRSPLDTCLSIYFQNFAHTRNSYAYNLDDLVEFYRGYQELMAHWEHVLPGKIHPVRYEELVEQPEKISRDLIAAAGLSWHSDCLEPHHHTGSISTASVWQARQPIYRSSVERWRNYRSHIQPLLDAFEG